MTRILYIAMLAAVVSPATAEDLSRHEAAFADTLAFERAADDGLPFGWGGKPARSLSLDREVSHSGGSAGRIDRTGASEGEFSTLTASIPVDFAGKDIELRGVIRMQDVSDFAGLWIRTDGVTGPLEFDSMQPLAVRGTHDWKAYSIHVSLTPKARKLVFGVLLSGTGTVWADDLELRVDGTSLRDVPIVLHELSILEKDHEFGEGSGIDVDAPSDVQTRNLAVLARVWGFLKYHHPRIAGGELHWDYELFRVMPDVLAAPDAAARNHVLLDWTKRIGEPLPCRLGAGPVRRIERALPIYANCVNIYAECEIYRP